MLLSVLPVAVVEDDVVNPDRRMRWRKLHGRDDEFGLGPVELEIPVKKIQGRAPRLEEMWVRHLRGSSGLRDGCLGVNSM